MRQWGDLRKNVSDRIKKIGKHVSTLNLLSLRVAVFTSDSKCQTFDFNFFK